MTVYQTAHYQVNADAVDKVLAAIKEFVEYVRENEPGTRFYASWQQKDDPTRFVHLFIFEDEAAHTAHGESAAVKKIRSRLFSRTGRRTGYLHRLRARSHQSVTRRFGS